MNITGIYPKKYWIHPQAIDRIIETSLHAFRHATALGFQLPIHLKIMLLCRMESSHKWIWNIPGYIWTNEFRHMHILWLPPMAISFSTGRIVAAKWIAGKVRLAEKILLRIILRLMTAEVLGISLYWQIILTPYSTIYYRKYITDSLWLLFIKFPWFLSGEISGKHCILPRVYPWSICLVT